ncbi:MAG: DUF4340 domain-containing protein [Proteobacteria bacterium]|jgi:hypothetical protein|nr:DUF4340 domain-containing protein [Pseudomonadota bacterium]
MNRKAILTMAVLVAVMAVVAVVMTGESESAAEAPPLFAGFDGSTVQKVDLRSAGGQVTLSMVDGAWQVDQRSGYPANVKKLSDLVKQLGSARLVEKKTSKSENHAALGVNDPEASDSEAVLVSLTTPGGTSSVIVGQRSSGREGSFVRYPDQQQVWLADEVLSVIQDPGEWLDPTIIEVDAESVLAVAFDGQEELVFTRDPEGAFSVTGLPAGRELKYPSIVDEPARALAGIRLEDVAEHDPARWGAAVSARFSIEGDTVVNVLAVSQDEQNWLHFSVEPGDEDTRTYPDLSGWDFQVASYVYDDFVKTSEDLLAAKPVEPGDTATGEDS